MRPRRCARALAPRARASTAVRGQSRLLLAARVTPSGSDCRTCATVVQILTKDKRVRARTLGAERRPLTVAVDLRCASQNPGALIPRPAAALLKLLGVASAVGAGGWALLSGGRANAYYQGPLSDHFDGVRFFNPGGIGPKGPGAFLKWTFGERGEAWPASFPSPHAPDRPPVRFDREAFRVTHVGHASYLIQTRGTQRARRSGLGRAREPVLVSRAQARQCARHRLRRPAARSTPCSSPTTTTTTWTWRRSGGCGSASARAS